MRMHSLSCLFCISLIISVPFLEIFIARAAWRSIVRVETQSRCPFFFFQCQPPPPTPLIALKCPSNRSLIVLPRVGMGTRTVRRLLPIPTSRMTFSNSTIRTFSSSKDPSGAAPGRHQQAGRADLQDSDAAQEPKHQGGHQTANE